jgi:hypothetical protein
MNPRAKVVEYKDPYSLIITFSNNEVKVFDLKPYLNYPVYQILKDESICRNAKVKYGTIVWDDETDIDPDRLYLESKLLELSS